MFGVHYIDIFVPDGSCIPSRNCYIHFFNTLTKYMSISMPSEGFRMMTLTDRTPGPLEYCSPPRMLIRLNLGDFQIY